MSGCLTAPTLELAISSASREGRAVEEEAVSSLFTTLITVSVIVATVKELFVVKKRYVACARFGRVKMKLEKKTAKVEVAADKYESGRKLTANSFSFFFFCVVLFS